MEKEERIKLIKGMIMILTGIMFTILISVMIVNTINNNEKEREALRVRRSEMEMKLFYAEIMFFEGTVPESEPLNLTMYFTTNAGIEVSDVVFVHSKAEATGFPEDVIVAWPSEYTFLLIERMNEVLGPRRFEGTNVTPPITVEDVVDNWEDMLEFWLGLADSQGTIRNSIARERRQNQIPTDVNEEIEENVTED